MKQEKPLSPLMPYIYGLPDFALNFLLDVVLTYITYYCIEIALVPAAIWGVAITVATICDSFSVPIAGMIMNKVRLKWGRYRSWMLIAAPLASGTCIALFQTFHMPDGIKAMYYSTLYVLMFIFVNLAYTGHMGMINKITKRSDERVKLSAAKAQMESVSAVLVSLITLPLIMFIGNGVEAAGFPKVVAIYALFNIAAYYLVAMVFKDCEAGEDAEAVSETKKKNDVSAWEMIKMIFTNRPLLSLILADTMRKGARNFNRGLAMFYFVNVCANAEMQTPFLTVSSLVFVLGSFAAPLVANRIGAKRTYVLSSVLYAAGFLVSWLAGGNAVLYIAIIAVGTIGYAANQALSPALFSACASYTQLRSGKDSSGFIMSLVQLPYKLGAVIGGWTSFALAAIGYNAASAVTQAQISGIQNITTLIPGAMMIVCVILMVTAYNISDKQAKEMEEQLSQKQ